MRKLIAAIAVVVASATLVACGGDDDGDGGTPGGGATISKADFIAQANEICAAGAAELATALGTFGPDSSPEDLQQAFVDTVIPNIRGQVADIRALGFPAGDEATLGGIFDQVEGVLDAAAADPASMLDESTDEFAEVNTKLTDYGLATCGEA